jgi:hypothetical protein
VTKYQVDDLAGRSTPYGYDAAYNDMIKHSMGQASWITVSDKKSGTAEFTFTGTGFDVISLTSSATGTIMIDVKNSSGEPVRTEFVDTYYGYKYENYKWTPDTTSETALYQIPVIKVTDLTHGTYTVTITAAYSRYLDHMDTDNVGESYDFYLDAIRIYNPADTTPSDPVIKSAYTSDNEYNPGYKELRDLIIPKKDFDIEDDSINGHATGIVFIDNTKDSNNGYSISDYEKYGPKNELYLKPNQSIAFTLSSSDTLKDLQLAMKCVDGSTYAQVAYVNGNNLTDVFNGSINTATDLYYSLGTTLVGKTVVIKNTGNNLLSITNFKFTTNDTPDVTLMSYKSEIVQLLSILNAPEDVVPPEQDQKPEQDQPGKEENPITGDTGIQTFVMISTCVTLLGVLVIVQTRKKMLE